jgi:hypothetical protein
MHPMSRIVLNIMLGVKTDIFNIKIFHKKTPKECRLEDQPLILSLFFILSLGRNLIYSVWPNY